MEPDELATSPTASTTWQKAIQGAGRRDPTWPDYPGACHPLAHLFCAGPATSSWPIAVSVVSGVLYIVPGKITSTTLKAPSTFPFYPSPTLTAARSPPPWDRHLPSRALATSPNDCCRKSHADRNVEYLIPVLTYHGHSSLLPIVVHHVPFGRTRRESPATA